MLDSNLALLLIAYQDPSCSKLAAELRDRCVLAVANPSTRAEWLRVLWAKCAQAGSGHSGDFFDALVIDLGDSAEMLRRLSRGFTAQRDLRRSCQSPALFGVSAPAAGRRFQSSAHQSNESCGYLLRREVAMAFPGMRRHP